MADTDDEYIEDLSEGDSHAPQQSQAQYGTRLGKQHREAPKMPWPLTHVLCAAGQSRRLQAAGQPGRSKERWEDIQRSWDLVTEGADGSLAGTVEGLLEAGKRKR